MWIQVRTFDGKQSLRVDNLSKLTKIEDLRKQLVEHFDAPVEDQRLFYRGKQLVDGHSLFDYSVGLNDLIQLLVKRSQPVPTTSQADEEQKSDSDKENKEPELEEEQEADDFECVESIYKVGDVVDARDLTMGAWFESKITQVTRNKKSFTLLHEKSKGDVKDTKDGAKDTVRQVLGESKIIPMDTNCDSNEIKDENENDKVEGKGQESSESAPTKTESSEESPYDKLFDIVKDDGFVYHVVYEGYEEDDIVKLKAKDIRPRAIKNLKLSEINIGDVVMANYNMEEPDTRGFWYDCVITGKQDTRTLKKATATVYFGPDLTPLENCKLMFVDELFRCEKPGTQLTAEDLKNNPAASPVKRTNKPDCDHCLDNPKKKCKHCACFVCGGKHDPDKQILCDECNSLQDGKIIDFSGIPNSKMLQMSISGTNKPDCDHCLDNPKKKCKHCACCVCGGKHDPDKQILCDECNKAYHLSCLDPPLTSIPEEDDWYCPACKLDDSVIVKAGEKLKVSKKKSKMASATSTTNRDWGKGMACVGRQKICTVVPTNHFGPIPGVEVGQMWKFRVQVSEAGVHRPHVAGIAGRESEGAYSIVLSGGYEDDTDNGDTFLYTGSGGRDLSGNKRTAEQSCDQTLTRMNKALARMCNAPIDVKNGATSKDWRKGKPVRVVRNCKIAKHSEYAPEEGNRYDGIYKVVRYWPEKGKSGFLVWRYMLERDDETPAPWTPEGKKRIEELGLVIEYPEGYLEAQAEKERLKNEGGTPAGKGKKGKRKHDEDEAEETETPSKKKVKAATYKVEGDTMKLIKKDEINNKLWQEALESTSEGRPKFLSKVEEVFTCICCQDLVFKPVTTPCFHNICKSCLQRSFKAEVTSCPACRAELGKDYSMPINTTLSEVLVLLFPGYEAGR